MGSPTGPVRGPTLSTGMFVTAGFGSSLASAGDTNGDGYGDAIVGGSEAAQLFLGGPTGLAATVDLVLSNTPSGDPSINVQGPGDVNGDGLPDILVTNGVDIGALYLGLPNAGGFFLQELQDTGDTGFGFAGDVNGDGFEDLNFFGLIQGTPFGVDPSLFLDIQPSMPFYAAAGDINGDGFGDAIRLIENNTGFPERYRISFGEDEELCGRAPACPSYHSVRRG